MVQPTASIVLIDDYLDARYQELIMHSTPLNMV